MKCEICNAIERLGLDSSAHDLWVCSDARPAGKPSIIRRLVNIFVTAACLHRITADLIVEHTRQALGAGLDHLPAHREHYIRLGL